MKINRDWNKDMSEVVQCRLGEKIDCEDHSLTRHQNKEHANCTRKWDPSQGGYNITVNGNGSATSVTIDGFVHGASDILGYLQCKIYDSVQFKSYKIEEPFQVRKVPQGNYIGYVTCSTG